MESCEEVKEDQSSSQSNQEKIPFENPGQLISDLTRVTTRGSARFGTLSHNSFFSRHNPHPHRVTHISGLNGSPVCTVNDDWYFNTPLCPHPLIKSQVLASGSQASFSLPHSLYSTASGSKQSTGLISEAWQEELKDLATKVSLSAAGQSQREEGESSREDEPPRRKTQYSSQTGRIIPPSSWGAKRRNTSTAHRRTTAHQPLPSILGGQELRVLELLCQILQTDSLSLVQQWLLLAGDREKELVLGLLQQAMVDSPNPNQQQILFTAQSDQRILNPPTATSRRKRRIKSVSSAQEVLEEEPERIGEAEVLQIHADEGHTISEHSALQREHSR